MPKMNYDFLKCARRMPPLLHQKKGEKFNISESEAAKWIASQPEVLQKVFDMARYKGVIQYDPESGMWRGADCDG